ncbi:MAG: hypothetical protein KJ850_00890 [Gammaproteobacteria bacterium]|nr:hypothetical protein [Gammaproteobacteria bacterium]MBU1623578.1 hypothetical protein [Gammaproteobacteria bacterium]
MLRLEAALSVWGRPEFEEMLKRELVRLGIADLPLQAALTSGSQVIDRPISVIIKRIDDAGPVIRAWVGIFFKSVIAGCSCADDPTPTNELDEFCELQLDIDKITAVTTLTLKD